MLVHTFLSETKFLKILYEFTKSNSSILQDLYSENGNSNQRPILFRLGHSALLTQGKINFRNKKIPRCISYCRRWTKLWQEKNTRRRQSRDFGCGWHSLRKWLLSLITFCLNIRQNYHKLFYWWQFFTNCLNF